MSSAQDLIAAALADIDSQPATPVETPTPHPNYELAFDLPPIFETNASMETVALLKQRINAAILERDAAVQAAEAAYARIAELENDNKTLLNVLITIVKTLEMAHQSDIENANMMGAVLARIGGLGK